MSPAEYIRTNRQTGAQERIPFTLSDYLYTQGIPTGGFSAAELNKPVMEMPPDAAASLIRHWNKQHTGYTYATGEAEDGND